MSSAVRVLVADDHGVLRDCIAESLSAEPDIEVVAVASSPEETVAAAKSTQPDVALVDVWMPHLVGPRVTADIIAACRRTRVLALSGYGNVAERMMLEAGACGYVLKTACMSALARAIRAVASGACQAAPRGENEELSSREREVLAAISWGVAKPDIAARLGLGVKTVELCKRNGMAKLKLASRHELVRYAVAAGWFEHDAHGKPPAA